jgi:hypothetical protein
MAPISNYIHSNYLQIGYSVATLLSYTQYRQSSSYRATWLSERQAGMKNRAFTDGTVVIQRWNNFEDSCSANTLSCVMAISYKTNSSPSIARQKAPSVVVVSI